MKLVVNNTTKVGRNDPCHCGSGQKYKKCCLDKDRAESYSPENFDPVSFKHEMEQMVRQIRKMAETKNMSVDDLNKMLVGKRMDDIAVA